MSFRLSLDSLLHVSFVVCLSCLVLFVVSLCNMNTIIEPWPIFIEDFQGRTHEVILTPGDILFYESSKCFHGRPKRFNGGWYSSLFVHYYPTHGWYEQNHALEAHYAIPPTWKEPPEPVAIAAQEEQDQDASTAATTTQVNTSHLPELNMIGTSMYEPHCPNNWCRTQDTVQWSGPGRKGVWIAPTGESFPFEPQPVVWQGNDNDDDQDDQEEEKQDRRGIPNTPPMVRTTTARDEL